MSHPITRACIVLVGVLLGSSCQFAEKVAPPVSDAETAVPAATQAMADAWNRGDLASHVGPYADAATFMTGAGPVAGRARVRESLERSFWSDGKPLQQLSFDRVTVRPLGDHHALETGRFLLSGGGRPDRSGWFSLTWEKTAEGWRIVHDHSS